MKNGRVAYPSMLSRQEARAWRNMEALVPVAMLSAGRRVHFSLHVHSERPFGLAGTVRPAAYQSHATRQVPKVSGAAVPLHILPSRSALQPRKAENKSVRWR